MFEVILKSRAEKEFSKLSLKLKQRFYEEFKHLSSNPFGCKIKKLQGADFGYRLRLGRWRILFALFQKEKRIEVVDIFFKKGKEDYAKRLKLLP